MSEWIILADDLADLREQIAADPDVVLVENTMTRDDMLALINAIDCVVSLHRAEGLGLLLSEAMMLRKPVISTDYSGSTELVLPSTGFPVEYRLTPVLDGQYPFAAGYWAEPDVFHAAWQMRSVYNNPNGARDKTHLAFEHLEQNYGFATVAARQLARLHQIGL